MTNTIDPNADPTPDYAAIQRARRDAEVAHLVQDGWHVVSASEYGVSVAKGKPTNHLLHVILCLITVGLWLPVWILCAIFAGRKERTVV